MSQLPPGWHSTTLGALGRYHNGRAFKKSEWRDSGRPIIRIQNLTGSSDAFNYFQGEADDRHVARPGDLLVSWAATLGSYLWNGPEAVINQHIFKVESNIDKRFHKYLLDQKLSELMTRTHGSGMVHITRSRFDAVPVSLPPLADQRRIVDLLEDHLSRLDAADGYLKASATRTSGASEAVLEARLAVTKCGDVALGHLLQSPLSNGRSVPTLDGGFPVLRLTALKEGFVDVSERKGGAWTEAEARRFLVRRGDFLLSRGNGSLHLVGRGGLVRDEPDAVAYPDTAIRVRVDPEKLDAEYFNIVWNSRIVRRQIEGVARTTAGIYKVNQQQLAKVLLPVPSLDEQCVIAANVRAVRDALTQVSGQVGIARRRAESLRTALLDAAFSGHLTSHFTSEDLEIA